MKIYINCDEKYPYFYTTTKEYSNVEINVTKKEKKWIDNIEKEFDKLTKFLEKKYEKEE